VQNDVFTDISIIRGNAREGLGYATQKPVQLLQRLVSAFCPPDGIVADFFCGSGTTGSAAQALGRRWLLADIGLPAIQTARLRLQQVEYTFARAPGLEPPGFDVYFDGRIRDFRPDALDLAPADAAVVRELLVTDPDVLIAGTTCETVIDVFGREARLG
jgi:hypothetical protein